MGLCGISKSLFSHNTFCTKWNIYICISIWDMCGVLFVKKNQENKIEKEKKQKKLSMFGGSNTQIYQKILFHALNKFAAAFEPIRMEIIEIRFNTIINSWKIIWKIVFFFSFWLNSNTKTKRRTSASWQANGSGHVVSRTDSKFQSNCWTVCGWWID